MDQLILLVVLGTAVAGLIIEQLIDLGVRSLLRTVTS